MVWSSIQKGMRRLEGQQGIDNKVGRFYTSLNKNAQDTKTPAPKAKHIKDQTIHAAASMCWFKLQVKKLCVLILLLPAEK